MAGHEQLYEEGLNRKGLFSEQHQSFLAYLKNTGRFAGLPLAMAFATCSEPGFE